MTFPDLSRYDSFAVDTETDGLGYTNRPVGIAISTPDDRDWYMRWGHEEGGNNCSLDEVRRWAAVELTRQHQIKWMHHAAFDMRMLAYENIGGLQDNHHALGPVLDTLVMANLLNELEASFSLDALGTKYTGQGKTNDDALWEYCSDHFGGKATRRQQGKNIWRAHGDVVEPYAKGDTRATLVLALKLHEMVKEQDLTDVLDLETALVPIVLRMHLVGVRLDLVACDDFTHRMEFECAKVLDWWDGISGGASITSVPQLARLFDKWGLRYDTTEKGNPSITKELLADLKNELEGDERQVIPDRILHYRHCDKFRGTYLDAYTRLADEDAVLHAQFHQVKGSYGGTVSGRFSSSDPNLQNVPARDKVLAPLVRGLFVPYYDSMDWVKADYSQIEYRFLAHYAATLGMTKLAQAYEDDPNIDFHQQCSDLSGIERTPAKTLNFATVYGAGSGKVASQLRCSDTAAREFLEQYEAKLPDVKRTYRRVMKIANTRGWIKTWGGRRQRFKKSKGRGFMRTHKALNSLLQGSAADLMKRAMVKVDKVIDWKTMLMHLTVHDELDFSKAKGDAGDAMLRDVREVMQDFDLTDGGRLEIPRVPIKVDIEVGKDWGHVEEWQG